MVYSLELKEPDGAFPVIFATSCFGVAPSQPVIDGWECWVVKRKEKTAANTEKRARWWLCGLPGVANEAGKLKNTGVRLAGWKESSVGQGAGVGGEEIRLARRKKEEKKFGTWVVVSGKTN